MDIDIAMNYSGCVYEQHNGYSYTFLHDQGWKMLDGSIRDLLRLMI